MIKTIAKLVHSKRIGAVIILSFFCVSLISNTVSAIDEDFYSSNDILYYNPDALVCSSTANNADGGSYNSGNGGNFSKPGAITLTGANNAEKVMNFLLDNGFPVPAASGMMGNFSVESRFDPTIVNPSSGAFGLAQWLGSRLTALKSYGGSEYNTLEVQVQFLMHELETTEKASNVVKKETDAAQAAVTWEIKFERSGGAAIGPRSNRAVKIFNEWQKNKALSNDFMKNIDGSGGDSSNTSSGGTSSSDSSCPTGGGTGTTIFGSGELKGYAFPIAAKKQSDIDDFNNSLNKLPCTGNSCHHDGTYAFDLGVKGYGAQDVNFNPNAIGAPVFAISDSTITLRNDNPNAQRNNCTQFTLLSSKDNHSWWYGHLMLKGAAVKQGEKVKAGQLLGYVGPSNCADNTAPHLHIDSGGGTVGTRNDLVSKVVNGLFNQLPK